MSGKVGELRHPSCPSPSECRIRSEGATTTLMAWTPVFDGDGNPLNSDPNTRDESYSCLTCRISWIRRTKSGVVSYADRQAWGNG